MTRLRRSKATKTLKDYLVPLIGLVFIIIIIMNSMSNGKNDTNNLKQTTTSIEINTENSSTQAYVVYPGDSKKKIEGNMQLYKGEKILVKDGAIELKYLDNTNLVLNRLGELKYQDNGELSLFSSDLWINTKSKLNIQMRYAGVNISSNAVLSLAQNEVGSSIYLLDGKIEVNNLVGKSTMLMSGQKITISRENASDKNIDLSIQKDTIDNFFKSSDWFIKNSGDIYLKSNKEEDKVNSEGREGDLGQVNKSGTGNIIIKKSNSLISITSFKDEERISTSNIDIKGKYNNKNIFLITINGQSAKINEETKTFSYNNFNLENNINDIIVKVYDTDRNLLGKQVYTIYSGNNKNTITKNTGFKVKTFALDASGFKFTSPTTSGEYITYTNFVTIKGIVPKGLVSKVVVNDYKLNSFNGVSWRYHARVDYNNLKKGTNIYEIKYYKKDGSLLYKNNYIIIKKVKIISKKKLISDEVKLN